MVLGHDIIYRLHSVLWLTHEPRERGAAPPPPPQFKVLLPCCHVLLGALILT